MFPVTLSGLSGAGVLSGALSCCQTGCILTGQSGHAPPVRVIVAPRSTAAVGHCCTRARLLLSAFCTQREHSLRHAESAAVVCLVVFALMRVDCELSQHNDNLSHRISRGDLLEFGFRSQSYPGSPCVGSFLIGAS